MATGGGLIGLTQNVNKRESARQDLNTMMGLLQLKKSEEAEEQQAELAYSEMLSKVQEESNKLLENDRMAIAKKSLTLQEEMRRKIKALGGTKKAFIKHGGISDLTNYKNSVIGSPEFQTFKENKVNMERILMVKEKKMGHLLNSRDLANLKMYNKNGYGKITYGGLLNEVKIDPKAYDYGTDITPKQVLEADRMAVIANWELDTGNTYDPSTPGHETQLLKYIATKGYGGVGVNTFRMQAKLRADIANARNYKSKQAKSQLLPWAQAEFRGQKVQYKNMDKYSEPTEFTKLKLGGKRDNLVMEGAYASKIGKYAGYIGIGRDKNKYKVKAGVKFGSGGVATDVATKVMGLKSDDEGYYTFDPQDTPNTYGANGASMYGKDARGTDGSWGGRYKATDLIFGWQGTVRGGENVIFVDPVNDKGEVDLERKKEMYGDDANPEANRALMIRMKSEDNNRDVFVKVDMDNDLSQKIMSEGFKNYNDVSGIQRGQQQINWMMNQGINETTPNTTTQETQEIDNEELEGEVDGLIFKNENRLYTSPALNGTEFDILADKYRSDDFDRNNLLKSFYLAAAITAGGSGKNTEPGVAKAMSMNVFDNISDSFGITELLYDKNMSTKDIITEWQAAERETGQYDEGSAKMYKLWQELDYQLNLNN